MQVLHDLIGQLQAERDVIDERIRLAAELLNTYDPTDPLTEITIPLEDEPVTLVMVAETKPKPKVKPKKQEAERIACPDCGQLFHQQGLGPHRARKHPDSAAKPLRAIPGHRDPVDTFGEEFYACSTCNHEEPNIAGMKRHTLVEHGRPVNDTERKAIAA